MKKAVSQHVPQIVITIVIVVIAAVIILKALGISFTKSSSPSAKELPSSPSVLSGQLLQTGGEETRTVAVRASTIALGSISNYTKLQGDVVSNNEIKIYPNIGGKLLTREVSVGDRVSIGTTIAFVDPSKVGEKYMPNPVESTVSGTVLSLPVHEGDTITTSTVIATVGDISRLKVSTAVPERFLANLKIGSSAEVSFDAIPGIVYTARISEMNPVLDTTSRTLKINLTLDRPDSKVLVGMSATVTLVTEHRGKVVVVPRSSITTDTNEDYIFVVKSDGSVEKRSVALGLEGEEFFEVKKGLSVGEQVVTEGKNSVTNGSKIKIIDGNSETEAGVSQ
ncbi:putative Efflux transporter, RND family, MFP subunit [uncultured spirochete]|uniref:Putative Efflux transporter, RND family, MFP subunit n=1 Tax=uncultured spirochete TaxID=156406 RepID=A0A3P3XSU0_9SPIR|nr:putative Efflux transporter, RND family, MFP subunit [uncultured spirochete]